MTKANNKRIGLRLKPIISGIVLGIIVIFLVLLLGALLISGEKLTVTFRSTLICIAGFLGPAVGGFLTAKKIGSAYAVNGIIVAVSIIVIKIAASVFSTDGELFDADSLKLAVFVLLGGIFGGLMAGKRKHKRKK